MSYSTIKPFFFTLVTAALLGLTACDSTIDKQPEQSIPPDQVFTSLSGAESALNGAYSGLQLSGSLGGASVLMADVGADITNFTGSFEEFQRTQSFTIQVDNGFVLQIWADHYDTINRANTVIQNTTTDIEGVTQDDVDRIVGQAKFIRAIMYFDLVRWFGEPFEPGTENDQPGVPLRTSAVESVQNATPRARASVDSVYIQVRNDLEDAISRLDVNTDAKRAGQQAANALLAKVSLYQGRWEEAANRAEEVINTDGFSLSGAPAEPYQNEQSSEIVYAVSFSNIDNPGVNDFPAAFYLPSDRGGRGDANPQSGFLEDAAPGDIRAGIGEVDGDSLLYNFSDAIWTNKWSDPTLGDDFPVLRVAEMYLIRAEALARMGSDGEARQYVNAIRDRAGLDDVDSSLSGQALIDEIIRQRRFELAFEGDRRHDLDRLGRTIENNQATVPPDDPQRLFPIPEDAVERNDLLEQNPGF